MQPEEEHEEQDEGLDNDGGDSYAAKGPMADSNWLGGYWKNEDIITSVEYTDLFAILLFVLALASNTVVFHEFLRICSIRAYWMALPFVMRN